VLRLGNKEAPQLGALCERRLAGRDRLPGDVGVAPQRQREPLLSVFEPCLHDETMTALPHVTSCVSSSGAGMPVLQREVLNSLPKIQSIGTASCSLVRRSTLHLLAEQAHRCAAQRRQRLRLREAPHADCQHRIVRQVAVLQQRAILLNMQHDHSAVTAMLIPGATHEDSARVAAFLLGTLVMLQLL
jgi:hypothetical protein